MLIYMCETIFRNLPNIFILNHENASNKLTNIALFLNTLLCKNCQNVIFQTEYCVS